jgi:hypothetical protein
MHAQTNTTELKFEVASVKKAAGTQMASGAAAIRDHAAPERWRRDTLGWGIHGIHAIRVAEISLAASLSGLASILFPRRLSILAVRHILCPEQLGEK